MKSLDRKLLRDLAGVRGQMIAITLVIASGIGTFVMSMSAQRSLHEGQEAYYRLYRFGDLFASVKRAPESLAPRLEEISGIAAVQTRIVVQVLLDIPSLNEPASAQIISIPDNRPQTLNAIHIRRGRTVEPGRADEVVISESFADAHGFVPGDEIRAIINGKLRHLQIVGIALSPEYIIQIKAGSLLPDDLRFGVFWMSRQQLEAAFDMKGSFNSVSLQLQRGASEVAAIEKIDYLLEPHGGVGAYGRDHQISHQMVSDEIRQLKTMAIMAPLIFLSVAAFLLNVVMTRLIGQQREQIASLKAFGYTRLQIGWHYLKMVLVIAIAGSAVGILFGAWLGNNLTHMYARFYRFPVFDFQLDQWGVLAAVALTSLAAVAGTLRSVRRAVAMPPAQAMRPEPPAMYRKTLVERLGLTWILPQVFRMVLRNVQRKPWKAIVSCSGIAMAVAVLILGSFSLDAVTYMMDFQYRLAQRQDISVTFTEPMSAGVVQELSNLPGVGQTERFRALATRIRFQHRSRRVGVTGIESHPQLFRLLDVSEQEIHVPDHGLMLSTKLAELLHVQLGDEVQLEVLESWRPKISLSVTALVNEYGGTNAYMNVDALNQLMREDSVSSGAFMTADPNQLQTLYQQLKQMPHISGINVKSAVMKSFEDTVAENIMIMRSFNVMFSIIIAMGVVYNSARISLSEQSRDLATLRVIGFTNGEVSAILLSELALFTCIAIPLGWIIGYFLAALMTLGLDTENYRIPLVINRSTYAFAAITVILGTIVSGLIVRRRIRQLDLVGVLKTKE
jgi:putative ABC transport system permease protein